LPDEIVKLCRVKSLAYQFLTDLFNELPASQREEISQSLLAQSRFAPTLQYIEHHLAHPLTNDLLAGLSHMSESHFAYSFKTFLGQTPAQYVLQRRIAWAAQQLLFTRDTIDTIAEKAGFANRFHFSRQFTCYMGSPPGAYRKSSRV
jgi:AraC-like DNA-binding protein